MGLWQTAQRIKQRRQNFTGTKLVIGVEPVHLILSFLKNNVSEFETATGITIEWVEIPHDNMHERFVQGGNFTEWSN